MCDQCGRELCSKHALYLHRKTHAKDPYFEIKLSQERNKDKPFVCLLCARVMCSKYSLQCHLKTHGDVGLEVLAAADDQHPRVIVTDQTDEEGRTIYKCPLCDKTSTARNPLVHHIRTHRNPFVCDVCDAVLCSKYSLDLHRKTHEARTDEKLQKQREKHSDKAFVCDVCTRPMCSKLSLERHMRTHSTERPHVCNTCNQTFKDLVALQNHVNTHTGIKPHKCKECDASFTTSG